MNIPYTYLYDCRLQRKRNFENVTEITEKKINNKRYLLLFFFQGQLIFQSFHHIFHRSRRSTGIHFFLRT